MDKIKVVMFDLDETVIFKDNTISNLSLKTIDRLIFSNIETIPTTGRDYDSIPNYIKDIKGINYIVSSNGALITKNDQPIFEAYLPHQLLLNVLDLGEALADNTFIATSMGIISNDKPEYRKIINSSKSLRDFYAKTTIVDSVKDYASLNDVRVKKIKFKYQNLSVREDFYQKFKKFKDINTVASGSDNIEITYTKASKGEALLFLSAYLGKNKAEILAIGDSDNDISMLKASGIGVAMKTSSKQLIEVSDIMTDSVENDGFSKAVNKIIYKEREKDNE